MDIGSLNGQKGVCRTRGLKDNGQQMARDRARTASQAEDNLVTAKEKAKVARDKHVKYLKDIAVTAGNGVTWKRIVSRWQNPRAKEAKAKVQAVSMRLRQADQKTLQLVDLACVCLENRVVIGSGTIVAKRRSLWTVVRRCLQHRNHSGMTARCKLKNRDRA